MCNIIFTEDTSVSDTVKSHSDDEEVKPKPVQPKTNGTLHVYMVVLYCILECNCVTSSDIAYIGLMFYELNDIVTFATSKRLNALLKV